MKVAFTLATVNFIAQAKTVADSLLVHNPEYVFYIILIDKNAKIDISFFGNIRIIEIESIGIPNLEEMVYRYSIFELCNALKPFCAEFFFNFFPVIEVVLYFDSDILIYKKLNEIEHLVKTYNIILTPHILQPLPYDGFYLSESDFLNSGIYNGGFFAITRSEESLSFLSWWKERMRTQCFVNFSKGLFVDQIWLNFVPIYFKKVKILDIIGYNVAYWNLHERKIENNDGVYMVNNYFPLVFFHFSGYDFTNPESISKYQNRYSFEDRKDIRLLYKDYLSRVMNNKYLQFSLLTCYYVQLKKQHKDTLPAASASTKLLSVLKQKIKRKLLS